MNSGERSTTLSACAEQPMIAPAELDLEVLTEDLALGLLQRPDLAAEAIQQISKNSVLIKSRKVRFAVAAHPRTSRRFSLRLIREFYTADLARFAVALSVAADLKYAAAELLLTRLPSITLGERISLARRAPVIVAAGLLLDQEPRVWQAALENPRLTEASIVKALQRPGVTEAMVVFLCDHAKWSLRPEIRAALLLSGKISLAHAVAFARSLPLAQVLDILHMSQAPSEIRAYLEKTVLK